MTIPATPVSITVIGGVDTHKHTHYAAAIDDQGRLLGHHEFPATDHGCSGPVDLDARPRPDPGNWRGEHGSFGATLTRALARARRDGRRGQPTQPPH